MNEPTKRRRRALSIPTRIFLAFALTLAAFTSVSVTSVVQHDKTARNLRLLHDGYLPLAVRFNEARGHQTNLLQDLERIFEASAWVRSRFDASRQTRLGARRRFVHHFEKAERASRAAQDTATMEGVRLSYQAILEAYDATQPHYDRFFAALDAEDDVAATEEHDALMELEREILRHYREAYAQLVDRLGSISAESASQERQASIVLGVLALLMLVVGLAATLWSQRILRPLPLLQERVAAVATGDLSSRKLQVRGDDELARLAENFEGMVEALAARDARLRDLRQMQAQIVAGLRAAVVVVDAEGTVRTVNPAAHPVLGLKASDVGARLEDRVELELETALAAVRSNGDAVFLEAQELGERRVDVLATPFGRDEGEVLLVADDVTDALRTKDRLIHTERLAAIGRMAAHVTHEVRNPLSSIGLNVEMLEDELADGDEEARALMRAIQREVDRLTGITEEYLRLARLPQPRLEADDLGELIRSVGQFVRREMEASKVELKIELDELPPVAFDEAQLRQALLNLLRNAREAMSVEGEVSLRARVVEGGVEIRVADRGPGIPAAERERIFDLFFTTKERGTGLGLPLTHQIVEAHSGRIECAANPEGGTVFTIWLPTGRPADAAAE